MLKNEAFSLFICVSYMSLMDPENLCTPFSFASMATKQVVGTFLGAGSDFARLVLVAVDFFILFQD